MLFFHNWKYSVV